MDTDWLKFFKTIPAVSQSSIFEYIHPIDVFLMFLQSPEVNLDGNDTIAQSKMKIENISVVVKNSFQIMITVTFSNCPESTVFVKTTDPKERIDIRYRKRKDGNELTIYCESEEVLCQTVQKLLNLMVTKLKASVYGIIIHQEVNGQIPLFDLIKGFLHNRNIDRMDLWDSSDRTKQDPVNGVQLNQLLSNLTNVNSILMLTCPDADFDFGLISPNCTVSMATADMADHQLAALNCHRLLAHIRVEFNPKLWKNFLESWLAGKNDHVNMIEITYEFTQEFTILQLIPEGVEARPWNPELREGMKVRTKIDDPGVPAYHKYECTFDDMRKGLDIVRADGTIATLLREDLYGEDSVTQSINFYVWKDPFPFRAKRPLYNERLNQCNEFLSQVNPGLLAQTVETINEFIDISQADWDEVPYTRFYKEATPEVKKIIEELLVRHDVLKTFSTFDSVFEEEED